MQGHRWSPQLNWLGMLCVTWSELSRTSGDYDRLIWGSRGMMTSSEKLKWIQKNLLQCRFVHHEPHMKSLGSEPEALPWENSA